MKNSTKLVLAGLAVLLVVGLAALLLHKNRTGGTTSSSASGTTFNDAKLAAIEFSPSTVSGSTATSTGIQNNDGRDRIITSTVVDCNTIGTSGSSSPATAGGIVALQLKVSTSSVASPATLTNTNFVYNATLATSSTDLYDASTSPGTTAATVINRIWASGSYLNFGVNATNTMNCIVGANYLAL